tara:strand:+ start:1593 stop:2705 length:1113 start_codon:yes stop_codon:yes gene_type:complete
MSRARDFADLASAYSHDALNNRNMIINGNMLVSQRNGTTAVTAEGYTLDRWQFDVDAMDNLAFEISQTNDVPATFAGGGGKSLKYQTKTVESALASDEFGRFMHKIEAQNCHRLLYGTSSAKSATLSFWVKSSLTGVFAVMLYLEDGGLNIGSTYTISSADTWEHKTITFVGNTSQAITHDNSIGLYVQFILMAGSSYVATDNTSWASYAGGRLAYGHAQNGLATTDESTWQLTGVQFEVGEVATPFENEAYGDTLRKCQRYYYVHSEGNDEPLGTGVAEAADLISWYIYPPVTMRTPPSVAENEGTNYYISYGGGATDQFDGIKTADRSTKAVYCYADSSLNSGGNTAGRGVVVTSHNASSKVALDAEL